MSNSMSYINSIVSDICGPIMRAIGQKLSSAFCNFELRPQKYTLHSISAWCGNVGICRRKSCWEVYLDNIIEEGKKAKNVTVGKHHSMDTINIMPSVYAIMPMPSVTVSWQILRMRNTKNREWWRRAVHNAVNPWIEQDWRQVKTCK